MKMINKPIGILLGILTIISLGIAGCSSTGLQRSKKTTTTMQTVDKDIKLVSMQLDATSASLEQLMKTGQSDVKKAFNLFKDNVSKIEDLEKSFAKHADEMNARGNDYFEEWQKDGKDYQNNEIRQLSEQRRQELSSIYGNIAQNSIGVKEAFRAYVSDVKEIRDYLSNDMTSNGIQSIVTLSEKVVNDGYNLKNVISNVQKAIDRALLEMQQTGR